MPAQQQQHQAAKADCCMDCCKDMAKGEHDLHAPSQQSTRGQ